MWLAIGLAAAGVLALILEVFVPAAGIIGLAGLGSIIASVVIAYQRLGNLIGSIYLAVVLVLVPVFIVLYFRFFPRSPVGRWLISQDRQEPEKGYSSYTPEKYVDLIGKEGTSLTILRPAGMVRIDGQKYSAVTGGEFIEKDKPIRVVKVEGSRVVVRQGGQK
jgi:membrane-bound serine protease (ClpP class)